MTDKPIFDPTQPFEPAAAASKPAFDPTKSFSPVAAPAPPISGPDGPVQAEPVAPKVEEPGWLETAKGAARGPMNFIGDMGEALAGPFGPIRQSTRAMMSAPEPTEDDIKKFGSRADYYRSFIKPGYGQQMAHAAGVDSANPGYGGSIAETATNPVSWFGPGGALAKMLMVGGSGAGGQLGHDVTEGTGFEPLGRAVGAIAGGPLAARAIKPQLAGPQETLAQAGVTQMTPGQLTGGMLKAMEDRITSIPILGSFVSNARGRSVESFNRAVANQALEPIGARVGARTEAGHPLVAEVEHRLSDAYDSLLPRLNFIPDRQFGLDLAQIRQQQVRTLPEPMQAQFERIIDARMGPPAPMHGKMLKTIESELNNIGSRYAKSTDAAQQDLGHALQDTVKAIRSNLERMNPDHAEELRNINTGWAMYARMRDAASRRATSEGVFLPSDLLQAVKRGDRSVGHGSFARGDALMQDFAEAGQAVLPSKLPTSGTAERAATMALPAIGAYLAEKPEIAAGAAAAVLPYTRPSQWMLNRYASARPGVIGNARTALSNTGRGAGTFAAPLASNPFGDETSPYAP